MLNLLNLFGLKRLSHLSQFPIVPFYVRWFHVLQLHVLSFVPSFSRPAFSAMWRMADERFCGSIPAALTR